MPGFRCQVGSHNPQGGFASKHLSTLQHLPCMRKMTALACIALAALTSCSSQKPISRAELKTKLRSAASIAAETSTFVDYVRQKRATDHYAQGHLEYLSAELTQAAKELREARPPAGAETQLADGRRQVDALCAELNKLGRRIQYPDELAGEQGQIATIHKQLQQVISSL